VRYASHFRARAQDSLARQGEQTPTHSSAELREQSYCHANIQRSYGVCHIISDAVSGLEGSHLENDRHGPFSRGTRLLRLGMRLLTSGSCLASQGYPIRVGKHLAYVSLCEPEHRPMNWILGTIGCPSFPAPCPLARGQTLPAISRQWSPWIAQEDRSGAISWRILLASGTGWKRGRLS
jgi:hypothetical protein